MWRWISNLFEIIVYFSLWSLTADNDADMRRLLIYYILFFGVLHNLQSSRVATWMGEDISSGQLNHYLTKPINFPLATVIRTTAMLITRVTVPVFLLALGALIFPAYLAPASPVNLIFFLAFAGLGLVIWNLLMVLVGCLAFWLTEIKSLITVIDLIFNFIKGAYIPVYLFSDRIKMALALTPFNYLTAFPTDIYQGLVRQEQLLSGFLVAMTWILILGFGSRWLYLRGVRRYEAFG